MILANTLGKKVRHLEENLADRITLGAQGQPVTLSVDVNADSLSTWFPRPRAVAPMLVDGKLLLDIRVDDQDQTHRFLKMLTALLSGRTIDVRLFWHCWNLKSPILESFTKALLHQGT